MSFATNTLSKKETSWDSAKTRLNTVNYPQLYRDLSSQEEPPAGQAITSNNNTSFQSAHPRVATTQRQLAVSRIRTFTASSGPTLSTQLAALPTGTQQADLRLSHTIYGLPPRLIQNFSSLSLNLLYPWQAACLRKAAGGNFVYSASTGAGKSLVADILMLRRVLQGGKKGLLVLPYVALVQEKTKWLRAVVSGLERSVEESIPRTFENRHHQSGRGIRVVPFFGGSRQRDTLDDADIAVATIEKANGLINQAIEEAKINDLGVLVVDELHMIDDENRGYLLEPLISKIRSLEQDVQIIGMSATLSNVGELARWLNATWYESDYKAVPVAEYLVYENKVYNANGIGPGESLYKNVKAMRVIEPSREKELSLAKHNAVVSLAMETVVGGYGVLVFCGSRVGCQNTASLLARASPIPSPTVAARRKEVLDSLRSLMNLELDQDLEQTIPMGVGFHHAGLTSEEKDIIAEAFDKGVLKALVATSSLAAGINLPARRVILQETTQGIKLVAPSMLRQMRGRAGRKGKDEIGESYVCCSKDDVEDVEDLLGTELPPATSCLTPEKRGIKRALLEVITIRLANHDQGLQDYLTKTLLFQSASPTTLQEMFTTSLLQLEQQQLIQVTEGEYQATALGTAIVGAGLDIDSGIFVYNEIKHALQHFVMDCDLHVIYLFTPVNLDSDISWSCFLNELDTLTEPELRVMEFTRINPRIVQDLGSRGKNTKLPESSMDEIEMARIYRRFYTALQLKALCEETPLNTVARRFGVSRGAVQTLSQTCHAFAASMISFCQRLEWGMLAAVMDHMADRLRAGARADLLELARIPFVKSRTARTLWDHGYRGLKAVAEADPTALAQVLLLSQPRKQRGEEEEGYVQNMLLRAQIAIAQAGKLWERETLVSLSQEV